MSSEAQAVLDWLASRNDPQVQRSVVDRLASVVEANPSSKHLADEYRRSLSLLIERVGIPPGLAHDVVNGRQVGGTWGNRASIHEQNLGHRTTGHGFAGEVIAAAHLLDHAPVAGLNGGTIAIGIRPGDGVALGARHSAGLIRRSVEADILIMRGEHRIGVDVKYRSGGTFGTGSEFRSQLAGVAEAIRAGELAAFVWATNGTVSSTVRREVAEADRQLREELGDNRAYLAVLETL